MNLPIISLLVLLSGIFVAATPPACFLSCVQAIARTCEHNHNDFTCICGKSPSLVGCLVDICPYGTFFSARDHFWGTCLERLSSPPLDDGGEDNDREVDDGENEDFDDDDEKGDEIDDDEEDYDDEDDDDEDDDDDDDDEDDEDDDDDDDDDDGDDDDDDDDDQEEEGANEIDEVVSDGNYQGEEEETNDKEGDYNGSAALDNAIHDDDENEGYENDDPYVPNSTPEEVKNHDSEGNEYDNGDYKDEKNETEDDDITEETHESHNDVAGNEKQLSTGDSVDLPVSSDRGNQLSSELPTEEDEDATSFPTNNKYRDRPGENFDKRIEEYQEPYMIGDYHDLIHRSSPNLHKSENQVDTGIAPHDITSWVAPDNHQDEQGAENSNEHNIEEGSIGKEEKEEEEGEESEPIKAGSSNVMNHPAQLPANIYLDTLTQNSDDSEFEHSDTEGIEDEEYDEGDDDYDHSHDNAETAPTTISKGEYSEESKPNVENQDTSDEFENTIFQDLEKEDIEAGSSVDKFDEEGLKNEELKVEQIAKKVIDEKFLKNLEKPIKFQAFSGKQESHNPHNFAGHRISHTRPFSSFKQFLEDRKGKDKEFKIVSTSSSNQDAEAGNGQSGTVSSMKTAKNAPPSNPNELLDHDSSRGDVVENDPIKKLKSKVLNASGKAINTVEKAKSKVGGAARRTAKKAQDILI